MAAANRIAAVLSPHLGTNSAESVAQHVCAKYGIEVGMPAGLLDGDGAGGPCRLKLGRQPAPFDRGRWNRPGPSSVVLSRVRMRRRWSHA